MSNEVLMKNSVQEERIPGVGSFESKPLNEKQFNYIVDEFIDDKDYRMALLCTLMAKSIRIGDCLSFTKNMLYTPSGKVRDEFSFIAQKTRHCKNPRKFIIEIKNDDPNDEGLLVKLLKLHYEEIKTLNKSAVLFYNLKRRSALTPSGVFRILNKRFLGKRDIEQISAHSFRKFAGRMMREAGATVELIQENFQHDTARTTRRYLGIQQEDVRKARKALHFPTR